MKTILYVLTAVAAFGLAFYELKLKTELTDEFIDRPSNSNSLNDLSLQFKRQRILERLPPEALRKYRTVVKLKFLFIALLIIEVIVLQR